jgi:hypothetical protein
MCRSRDGSAPQSRVRIHRSRWFCSRWQKRVAVPRQARHSPHAIALSHCLNRSWSRYEKRRQALAPAARQGSAQAGPAALAPRRRGTRILQSERNSPPLSTSRPHTPRNDRSRACRRLGCHHSQRRCPATPAGAGTRPRLPLRRASGGQKRHRRCFPPWPCGLVGLQQRALPRGQYSSLHERFLTTAPSHLSLGLYGRLCIQRRRAKQELPA